MPRKRRNGAVQHVIHAAKHARSLNGHNVVRLFHDADLRVLAMRIAAVEAQVTVTDVVALGANAELVFDIENGLRQSFARPRAARGADETRCAAPISGRYRAAAYIPE